MSCVLRPAVLHITVLRHVVMRIDILHHIVLRLVSYVLLYCVLQSYNLVVLPFYYSTLRPSIVVHFCRRTIFLKPYVVLGLYSYVLYCYKILGHGTTPCPWMMRALSLKQSPGISYEVTHNPLSQYL
jgi:hypothetical protein